MGSPLHYPSRLRLLQPAFSDEELRATDYSIGSVVMKAPNR
ncbi:hypothetical protein [Hymenobacter sp. AT01-02]|nr:hypothetical protein [Hymenobacter sp. AT01-02]